MERGGDITSNSTSLLAGGSPPPAPEKTVGLAYLAWLVFGLAGGHRFYVHRSGSGLAMACTLALGILLVAVQSPFAGIPLPAVFLWWLVDLFLVPRLVRQARAGAAAVNNAASAQFVSADEKHSSSERNVFRTGTGATEGNPVPRAQPSPLPFAAGAGLPASGRFDRGGGLVGGAAQASRIAIEYADVDGVVTEREIDIRAVEASGGVLYLNAFCHLRGAERTFRVDRILSARKGRSGPVIADIESYLVEFLPADQLPDPQHDAVMAKIRPTLSVLVWIANADRQISVDEMEVLLAFIGERSGDGQGKAWKREKAVAWIDEARPTFAVANAALAKLSRNGKVFAMTQAYAERISEAGGPLSENRRRQLFG